MKHLAVLLLVAATGAPAATAAERPPYDDGKLSFSIRLRDQVSPYRVLGLSVLPRERLTIEILDRAQPPAAYDVQAAAGALKRLRPRVWEWTAPAAKGLHPLTLSRQRADGRASSERMTLNAFVLVPLGEVDQGSLNGYRIGSYPLQPLKGLAIYKPPRGFIEVTPELADTPVSPHFTLGQFLCKQADGYPKYVVLRELLLLKLELLLQHVNAAGHRCDTFHVMSGYRTPFYNKAIGNVRYSRHVWGGAADIFIDDSPQDGMMDDLNRDGRIDVLDAGVLYDLVDELYGKAHFKPFVGGLGRYKKTSAHGPFVHVDVRGFRARWGT